MATPNQFYPRAMKERIAVSLEDTPATFLRGARQVGKSTLAASFANPLNVVSLDTRSVRAAAQYDPEAFIEQRRAVGPLVIDEIQRVPDVLIALKAAIDQDRRPGQFILTGSANIMTLPHVAETLAGRIELITISPLTRSEIHGYPSCLKEILLGREPIASIQETRTDLLRDAQIGGFPEVLKRTSSSSRSRWFSSYVETTITREIREITQIADITMIFRLLTLVASRIGGPRNIQSLAHDSGIAASTLRRLLAVLETTFILSCIPAWFINSEKRITKQPKMLFVDPGLYAYISGGNPPAGPLLEQYVGCELQRLLSMSEERLSLYHYRTQRGAEVDWVIERANGHIIGCEIKAATSVQADDFCGLRDLQEAAQSRLDLGIIFYTGTQCLRFGPRFMAVPIMAL